MREHLVCDGHVKRIGAKYRDDLSLGGRLEACRAYSERKREEE